jgi:acyl-CoA synthetase (AMP-forming)/AMP-acid ligase II
MQNIRAFSGIEFHAQYYPELIAVIDDEGAYSYRQLFSDSRRAVTAFRENGLLATDRVAMVSDNRYEAIVLILAGLLGGPVVVPVNSRMAPEEILWVLNHAQSTFLMSDGKTMSALTEQDAALSTRLLCKIADKTHESSFLNWLAEYPEAAIAQTYLPNRPYLQVYTSGTSGKPKGVVLTERNALGQLSSLLMCLDVGLGRGEILYEGLPVFHVGGIMVSLLALNRGVSIRFLASFNPMALLDLVCAAKIDHVALVPAMIQACQNTDHNPDLLRKLKTIMYGASPITETLLCAAKDRYQCDFFQIYGMTETHSVITVLGADDHKRLFAKEIAAGTAGKPVPGSTVKIINAEGNEVANGEAGEIRVSSQHVMDCYWNDTTASNEAIQDGFLCTGDVAFISDDGFLYIMDRIKDLIISGGENVSSLEVENALIAHPKICDIAVVGTPDERWGECVTAVVVKSCDSLNKDEVIVYGKQRLAGFKAPKRVIFMDGIPRNTNGKILKKQLREICSNEVQA